MGRKRLTEQEKRDYKNAFYRDQRKDPDVREAYNNRVNNWRKNNPQKVATTRKKWRVDNPAKLVADNAKRKAALLQRTVSWADLGRILTIYEEASRLTQETGIVFHVDHVIPLQGDIVSGLHVENNLQIIPAQDNMAKGNKFEPEFTAEASGSRPLQEIQHPADRVYSGERTGLLTGFGSKVCRPSQGQERQGGLAEGEALHRSDDRAGVREPIASLMTSWGREFVPARNDR